MHGVRFGLFLMLLLPALASADVGFARSSLWLSTSDTVEGQSATLYASLSNASEEKLLGSVLFSDDGKEFGKVALALEPGEGRIVSVSWKPDEAGTHSLRAVILSGEREEIDHITIAVVVAEKPEVKGEPAAVIEGSEEIQKTIADLSPQVSETLNPVFEKLDDLRQSGAVFLDGEIENAKQKFESAKAKKEQGGEGGVLGASDTEGRKLTVSLIFNAILLYTLSAIRYAVGNAAIFYPLLATAFFIGLYKLVRRLRNPAGWASDI